MPRRVAVRVRQSHSFYLTFPYTLPYPPSIHLTSSPHTQSLAKELGLRKKQMTDLMTETDDSVSLITYLKVGGSCQPPFVHVVEF